MLNIVFSRLSYANVVSTLALFLALGGVSYAAIRLPAGSVGAKQLRRNAVVGVKIKNRAVSSSKIGKNAVTGFNVAESTLAPVPEAAHAVAADSATAAPLARIDYEAKTVITPASGSATTTVSCPAGLYLSGGGATLSNAANATVTESGPIDRTTWQATVAPQPAAPASTMTVFAICAAAAFATP
jgi:hypothetical protein